MTGKELLEYSWASIILAFFLLLMAFVTGNLAIYIGSVFFWMASAALNVWGNTKRTKELGMREGPL